MHVMPEEWEHEVHVDGRDQCDETVRRVPWHAVYADREPLWIGRDEGTESRVEKGKTDVYAEQIL